MAESQVAQAEQQALANERLIGLKRPAQAVKTAVDAAKRPAAYSARVAFPRIRVLSKFPSQ
jgi:hypothetical protein